MYIQDFQDSSNPLQQGTESISAISEQPLSDLSESFDAPAEEVSIVIRAGGASYELPVSSLGVILISSDSALTETLGLTQMAFYNYHDDLGWLVGFPRNS